MRHGGIMLAKSRKSEPVICIYDINHESFPEMVV